MAEISSKKGVLYKQSKHNGLWQKRFCAINGSFLTIYKNSSEDAKGLVAMVDLAQVRDVYAEQCPEGHEIIMQIASKAMTNDENAPPQHSAFKLMAESSAEAEHWVGLISHVRDKATPGRKRRSKREPKVLTPITEEEESAFEELRALAAGLDDTGPLDEPVSPLTAMREVIEALEKIAQSPPRSTPEEVPAPIAAPISAPHSRRWRWLLLGAVLIATGLYLQGAAHIPREMEVMVWEEDAVTPDTISIEEPPEAPAAPVPVEIVSAVEMAAHIDRLLALGNPVSRGFLQGLVKGVRGFRGALARVLLDAPKRILGAVWRLIVSRWR